MTINESPGKPPVHVTQSIWRRSSHSGDKSECVEIASFVPGRFLPRDRHNSSHSGPEYNRAEAAAVPDRVAVRDSKDPEGPTLILSTSTWRRLSQDLKVGRFDL